VRDSFVSESLKYFAGSSGHFDMHDYIVHDTLYSVSCNGGIFFQRFRSMYRMQIGNTTPPSKSLEFLGSAGSTLLIYNAMY
jgi:hypothetical protein